MNRKQQHYSRRSDRSIVEAEVRGRSQAIKKTIRLVEDQLGIKLPRGRTPSESRQLMIDFFDTLL